MRCSLPPHREGIPFNSYDDYEVHYNKAHVNRCVECRKNFPTNYFLSLHQAENHDPLAEVLKDRGERTYACFVEDCERRCSTPQKRRMHLIDKHMFPKDYDFKIVDDGIDQRNSMLRSGRHRRWSSTAQHKHLIEDTAERRTATLEQNSKEGLLKRMSGDTDGGGVKETANPEDGGETHDSARPDAEMDRLAGAMSALKFIPPSVRFGRGKGLGRSGFSKT